VFLALGRLAATLLYNTKVFEPGVLAFAVAPLVVLAAVVTYWQARRLGAVAPIEAIRNEP
jgi:ABC-type antimicrobial peptide transport system permease subunit